MHPASVVGDIQDAVNTAETVGKNTGAYAATEGAYAAKAAQQQANQDAQGELEALGPLTEHTLKVHEIADEVAQRRAERKQRALDRLNRALNARQVLRKQAMDA